MNILDILFPKRCVGCGKIGQYICRSCRKEMIPIASNECICPVCEKQAIAGITHPKCRSRYSLDGLSCFFYYNTIVREIVKTIKYRFVRDAAMELVNLIPLEAYEIQSLHSSRRIVLFPIPLHRSRLNYRGFNQAETFGALIASRLNIPIRSDILIRNLATTPQVEKKNRKERLQNMNHVFSVNAETLTQYGLDAVILFDDIFTTGATMRAATGALKRHGVKFVWGVTIAR